MIEIKPCKKCGANELYIKEKGGTKMLYCKKCNTYQCNIPKKDLEFVKSTIEDMKDNSEIEERLKHDNGVRYTTDEIIKMRKAKKLAETDDDLNEVIDNLKELEDK